MAKVETNKAILSKALYLSQIEEEFTLTRINSRFELASDYFGNSHSKKDTKLTPVELGFIRRVKNHVIKEGIPEKFSTKFYYPNDIQYVDVKPYPEGTIIENIVEIDINEAYWRTAFLLNVINLKLYIEGSKKKGKISKIGRLVPLGALAKKKDIYEFVGHRLRKHTPERSKLTENIWYSICKRVADLMNEAKQLANEDFYLYWVDGIYVKNSPELIKKIKNLFTEYNYEVKTKENLQIEYYDGRAVVEDMNNGNKRPFFISKNQKKPSYFTDKELKATAKKYSKYGVMDDLNEDDI